MTKPSKLRTATPERKASVPLHVMLEPEQMARYRSAQRKLGISMRELAVQALDHFVRQQEGMASPPKLRVQNALDTLPTRSTNARESRGQDTALDCLRRLVMAQAERISKLEAKVNILAVNSER